MNPSAKPISLRRATPADDPLLVEHFIRMWVDLD